MMDYVDFKTIHTISKNNNDKVNLCFISFIVNRQSCACIDSASNSKGLTLISNVAAVYSSFFESITYGSQSITDKHETCSKVFSIKPAPEGH